MQRYLYLLRHAQSADKQHGQTDRDRELTPQGMRESLLIANYLKKDKTAFDLIFHSNATRAKTTATLVSDNLQLDAERLIETEELYEASTRTFFQFLTGIEDSVNRVLCVAHNPAISYLAEYLTKAEISEMVPAGLAIIELNVSSWMEITEGIGELKKYVRPGELRNH